ncbi:hypothetical protein WA158_007951 [Blastocystis sp. Blastoise]
MNQTWDVHANEDRDGVRFSFNTWPGTRVEATRCVIPMGCLYTPLKMIDTMPQALPYSPIRCRQPNCNCVLNPYCQIDFRNKLWTCPFCNQRNHFPPEYAQSISETTLPYELMPQCTTVEYEIQGRQSIPPVFLLVIDTTTETADLDELKDSLQQNLNLLPDNTLIGLITYGSNIQVHELGGGEIPRSYVFNGKKEYTSTKIADMLGLRNTSVQMQNVNGAVPTNATRFIAPLSECGIKLDTLLGDIEKDPWPVESQKRPERCTGTALSIASSLLEVACPQAPCRIITFVSGPCTAGPGMIVTTSLAEPIRQHVDIEKEKAPYLESATKYYSQLAERCRKSLQTIDLFACSLDQVGVLEMRNCIETTGGHCVIADFFKQSVFKQSFERMFDRYPSDYNPSDANHLMMAFSSTLEVLTTAEYKVSGAIGPCVSLKKAGPCVGDMEIGEYGTNSWYLGCMDPSTTLAIYFEIVNSEESPVTNKRRYLQIVTNYTHPNGHIRMRVSTMMGGWHSDFSNMQPIATSFDQEASAVMIARLASFRIQEEPVADVLRWIDRSLIRLSAKFADYRPDDPASFRLSPEFAIFPQFLFHLRRSQFIQHINYSPDETCYQRMMLFTQTTTNCLVMIQPALLSYSFSGPPQAVLLDIASVKSDAILLLDSFFTVVVFHGATIAAWRQAGYQDSPEHANFKQLLEAPQEDAQTIIEGRFPVPRYIVCDEGKSQARFLMAKVNPSVTHNSMDGSHAPIFTDDVSLKVFMEHLIKLAVQS